MRASQVLAWGGCGLVAAVAALWLWHTSATDEPAPETSPSARAAAPTAATRSGPARRPRLRAPQASAEPGVVQVPSPDPTGDRPDVADRGRADDPVTVAPGTTDPAVPADVVSDGRSDERADDAPRVYLRPDGILVRDHRRDPHPDRPVPRGPVRRPDSPGLVDRGRILDVRTAIRPVVYRCRAALDQSSLGPDPRVQIDVVVSISGGRISMAEVNLAVVDVAEPAAEGLRQCLHDDLAALVVDASGHADVDAYSLSFPFRLRR